MSREVYVREVPLDRDPLYSEERAVRILLECWNQTLTLRSKQSRAVPRRSKKTDVSQTSAMTTAIEILPFIPRTETGPRA